MGLLFYPRGGSAQVARYLAAALDRKGWPVRLFTGSLGEPGAVANAATFFAGLDLAAADFTRRWRHSSGATTRWPLRSRCIHHSRIVRERPTDSSPRSTIERPSGRSPPGSVYSPRAGRRRRRSRTSITSQLGPESRSASALREDPTSLHVRLVHGLLGPQRPIGGSDVRRTRCSRQRTRPSRGRAPRRYP
jgi:hypothetical protein